MGKMGRRSDSSRRPISYTGYIFNMSIVPSCIIKTHAESLGITTLSEEFITALAQDVEYHAREIIQEAAKFAAHSKRTKLSVDDINYALQARNVERLYGYDPSEALSFRVVPNTTIFYVPREEVDLETFIQQPLPKAPQPLTLTSHWLAIDGIQPAIPENPNLQEPGAFTEAVGGTGPILRRDLQEEAEVRPLVKHVISKELQAYYDTVISEITSPNTDRIKAALYSVATDSGLQQLLPYFIQFVAEMVPKNLQSLHQLQIYIGLVSSLLANEHIFLEPYNLCEDPAKEDHWSLRDRCALIAAELCRKFGNSYATLVPRVTKTMVKTFLDAGKPLPSHYGAIMGITALGSHSVETLLVPHMESYLTALGSIDDTMSDEESSRSTEISKVQGALRNAANKFLAEANGDEEKQRLVKNLFKL